MNLALEDFLNKLEKGVLVHFIVSTNTTIIGKFSRVDERKENIILDMASAFGETLFGETNIVISEITAWGVGGKFV